MAKRKKKLPSGSWREGYPCPRCKVPVAIPNQSTQQDSLGRMLVKQTCSKCGAYLRFLSQGEVVNPGDT